MNTLKAMNSISAATSTQPSVDPSSAGKAEQLETTNAPLPLEPRRTYLKDYRPPAYLVPEIDLTIELAQEQATITSVLTIEPGEKTTEAEPLRLNGKELSLKQILVNGKVLAPSEYSFDGDDLCIHSIPRPCKLQISTEINPAKNKSASGLYTSRGIAVTQMEAEGFRRMMFFPDRPDVMSRYTTTIIADKKAYPVLLSNGNEVAHGQKAGDSNKHFVTYHDPFPKPCYLFAMVAGNLECLKDTFVTMNGKRVALEIYTEPGRQERAVFAMESLKHAMRWDEKVFGLEYDLDTFRIASVSDFNAGAMENKGLNIFNDDCLLADRRIATDRDFLYVQGVVAHEYFHNYTGDRVTCRDWFQLTLKEGLTVLRDQLFSEDMNSRPVERVGQARAIRRGQFPEDAGPQAHPIQPSSYIEIDNFYTSTVYRKGAEVIRMLYTMLGRETFIRGVRKYLEINDGKAATVEDFIHGMEIVSGKDLSQFMRWYSTPGTPSCKVTLKHDSATRVCEMIVEQSCPKVRNYSEPQPLEIPLAVALFSKDGKQTPLRLEGEPDEAALPERTLVISQPVETFRFQEVDSAPIPSLLRNFSAPVKVQYDYSIEDLLLLLAHETDPFNRYEAGQKLAFNAMRAAMPAIKEGKSPEFDGRLTAAFAGLFADTKLDTMFRAEALVLPSLTELTQADKPVDFETAYKAKMALTAAIALTAEDRILEIYRMLFSQGLSKYRFDGEAVGNRRLMNTCLSYLLPYQPARYVELAETQYNLANNMNDKFIALAHLCNHESPARERVLADFINTWNAEPQMCEKWLRAQAFSDDPKVLQTVKRLCDHPSFDRHNPNHIRAVYGAFGYNSVHFHHISGEGYRFIAGKVLEVDSFNHNVAASLAEAFEEYARLDPQRKALAKAQLELILNTKGISPGVYEIVSNTLAADSV